MRYLPTDLRGVFFALLRIVIALYGLIVLGLFFLQEKIIFVPEKLAPDFQFHFASNFTEHWLEFEGYRLNSLRFKAQDSQGAILYFHGNAGSLASWGEVAQELSERTHWDVWVIDFPGYGKSEGKISSEEQLHRMAEAFWTFALHDYPPRGPVVVFGRSIGTGIAAKLAANHELAGLVLESPYFSLTSLVRERLPWIPAFELKYSFHSDQWLTQVKAPVLILHGIQDEVIPVQQGQRLSMTHPQAHLEVIEGGHHNDLGAFDQYWQALLPWIAERAH